MRSDVTGFSAQGCGHEECCLVVQEEGAGSSTGAKHSDCKVNEGYIRMVTNRLILPSYRYTYTKHLKVDVEILCLLGLYNI
jgi:hypothetical protein